MSTFDNFIKGSKAVFSKVGEETDKFIDSSKTNINILSIKQDKAKYIKSLGELIFKNSDNKEIMDSESYKDLILKIKELDERILELEKEKKMKSE